MRLLSLGLSAQASHCGGSFVTGTGSGAGASVVTAHGLSGGGAWLSHSEACGISRTAIEPETLALQGACLTTGPAGSPSPFILMLQIDLFLTILTCGLFLPLECGLMEDEALVKWSQLYVPGRDAGYIASAQ